MRNTSKKSSKLTGRRRGVILITVLFIVAMAVIFITTALTISLATRRRIYENTKDDQARLTAVSTAQTIWQAIYAQQITDAQLRSLAKGNTNKGTVIEFKSDDIPGMVAGSNASTTAYFFNFQNASGEDRIGIEVKCDIDGHVQYYTMALKQNSPRASLRACLI